MTVFQDRLPNDMASLVRRIEALERSLQQAQAARRLEAATIGRGGITIKGGAIVLQDTLGNEIGRMGVRDDIPPAPDGTPQPGFILRRNDGSLAFSLDDPNPNDGAYKQLLKMQDASGHLIFSEDTDTGWGLASPTLSVPLYPRDYTLWPGTTGTTYSGLWAGFMLAWNPFANIGFQGIIDGSGTGSLRLVVNGTQFGDAQSLNTTAATTYDVTVPLSEVAAQPGELVQIVIEARLSAGATGRARAVPLWVNGAGTGIY